MATSPYEIIAGPAQVWVAAVDTAFPDVDEAPAVDWKDLGDTEGGITARHQQTVELIRVDQATGPKKAIRSEEGLEIEMSLAELTLENFARALNNVAVAADAGPPAIKTVNLRQGLDVAQVALLCRGPSPYGDFEMQYQVPITVQIEEPEASFVRDDKAVLAVKFTALEDGGAATEAERFGQLIAQTA